MSLRKIVSGALIGATGFGIVGCSSNAGTGAMIGGASGAGIGAIIGHNSHDRTAGGALIGGAVGALGGALVGNEIDKQQAREREDRAAADGPYRENGNGSHYGSGYDYDRERGAVVEREYDYGPPPPVREELVTVRPYPRAVWVQGYWARDVRYHRWVWVPGHWIS